MVFDAGGLGRVTGHHVPGLVTRDLDLLGIDGQGDEGHVAAHLCPEIAGLRRLEQGQLEVLALCRAGVDGLSKAGVDILGDERRQRVLVAAGEGTEDHLEGAARIAEEGLGVEQPVLARDLFQHRLNFFGIGGRIDILRGQRNRFRRGSRGVRLINLVELRLSLVAVELGDEALILPEHGAEPPQHKHHSNSQNNERNGHLQVSFVRARAPVCRFFAAISSTIGGRPHLYD